MARHHAILWTAAIALASCSAPQAAPPSDASFAPDAAAHADAAVAPDASLPSTDAGSAADAASCELPDPPRAVDGGYPLDGWRWQKLGTLWSPGPSPAQNDGDIGPALVEAQGALHLFFTRKTGLTHRIFHSSSTDGEVWSAPEEATGLAAPAQTMVAYPTVLFEGGKFRMWFCTGSVDLAESTDGVGWSVVATGVLSAGAAGTFDAWGVLYPSVLHEGGAFTLWCTGFDGQAYAIGRATSADGQAWTRSPPTPVLARGAAADYDNHAVAMPRVARRGGELVLWYGAYDTSKTDPGPYRIASADSADGIAFNRRGVSIELAASGADAYSTRDPAVVAWRGGWLMVYSGLGDDRRYRLMRATSKVCP
jgi:predicted GH43/DUF377 family glycosyl hydrolase